MLFNIKVFAEIHTELKGSLFTVSNYSTMHSFLEKVDVKQEIDKNYECFDFLDMLSFEVSKYFKPFLQL